MTFRPGIRYIGTHRCGGIIGDLHYRKSSPYFYPLSISGCALWMDASQENYANNASIALLTDLSGSDNHLTQSIVSKRPIYKTNIINSLPVIRFDEGDFLISDGSITAVQSGNNLPVSIFIVTSPVDPTAVGTFMSWNHNGAGKYAYFDFQYEEILLAIRKANDITTLTLEGEETLSEGWVIAELIVAETVGSMWETGVLHLEDGDMNAGDCSNIDNFTVGGRRFEDLEMEFITGDIAEIIIYNSALSNTNRVLTENYLISKYGLA